MGVRAFETADCYAEGRMEERIGARVPENLGAFVVTKIGTRKDGTIPRKDFAVDYLKDALQRSRDRLKRDTIDCVLLHNPSRRAFDNPLLPEFMRELKERGMVRCWGVSAGTGEVGRAAMQAGAEVLELAYNVFHAQEMLELEAELGQREVGVLARSTLAHGLLCGLWPPDKQFAANDHRAERWSTDELRRRISQLNPLRTLLSAELPSLRGIALRFVLSNTLVSSAVLGPRNCLQLDQLVREAGKEPPYLEDQKRLDLRERLVTVGVYV
jgi:aryl-alcohol dehydrogenase-like predicted oxidoreductase